MIIYSIFFLIFLPPLIYVILKIGKDFSQKTKRILVITFVLFMYVGLGFLLDRLIIFNPEIFIFRRVFGLSLPFIIIGITSMVIFFILLYHNIKHIK